MSKELKTAFAIAEVGIVGLLTSRIFSSTADSVAVVTVVISMVVTWHTTQYAKKSTLRLFLIILIGLIVGVTFVGGVLLTGTKAAMTIYLLLGAFVSVMVYYHTVRFLQVPADRSRQVLVKTIWAAQVYVIAAGVSSFFGFMILARMSNAWVLVLTVCSVGVAVYPWYRFAIPSVPQRIIAAAVVILVVAEVTWASALLPFGFGVRGVFPAIAAAVTLAFVAKVNGEQVRDKTMTILYAAAAISIVSILVFARWI